MSVYAPLDALPAFGGRRTTQLNRAVAIAGQALGQAATEVAGQFTPAEWDLLSRLLVDFQIQENVPRPAGVMADVLAQTLTRLGLSPTGTATSESGSNRSNKADKQQQQQQVSLVERVRGLTYLQAWALLVAVFFRRDHKAAIAEGAHWWELAVRWQVLCGDEEESEPEGEAEE